jgi:citrate lyase subunit beta/citryl-CoA lyase
MLPERLRRSCLTVPAASPRLLAKARFIPADQIMVDLEDGVAREQKTSETRAAAVAAVRDGEWGDRTVSVRVNGVDTPWCLDDLLAVVGGAGERLDSVVVPKVEAERHVHFLHQLLTQLDRGRAQPLAIEVQIESPKGLLELERILSASSRIEAVVYGPADYAASAGLPQLIVGEASPGAEYPMARIAATAHAFGIQAIDGPYARLDDIDGLHASAARARARLPRQVGAPPCTGRDGERGLHADPRGVPRRSGDHRRARGRG